MTSSNKSSQLQRLESTLFIREERILHFIQKKEEDCQSRFNNRAKSFLRDMNSK